MNRPGANHLDRRRRLTPRDYFPAGFDRPGAQCAIPPGGDALSAAVARVQRDLVALYRQVRVHGSGTRTAGRFGISQSVWSRVLSGERWMGETVMAALLQAVLERQ